MIKCSKPPTSFCIKIESRQIIAEHEFPDSRWCLPAENLDDFGASFTDHFFVRKGPDFLNDSGRKIMAIVVFLVCWSL